MKTPSSKVITLSKETSTTDRVHSMFHRRQFLAATALTAAAATNVRSQPTKPTLDIHIHLFGIGEGDTGCRMAKVITDGIQFKWLTLDLKLKQKGKTLDEGFANVLVEQFQKSGLSKAAILGQDAIYDANGKPDWTNTSFYTPNDYVFSFCEKHKDHFLPCPNINPNRADAIEELNRVHAKGAKLFKIHPPTQGVDIADRKHRKFFQRCADLKILVLVHTGHEHSAPVIDKELANPKRMEMALDAGCRMVACHAGTGWPSDKPDQLPDFLALLKLYPNLYGDTSVLGTLRRDRDFYRLLEIPEAKARLLHGSDFPFPSSPRAFVKKLGEMKAEALQDDNNWIRRDFELKNALFGDRSSAERAYEVVMGKGK